MTIKNNFVILITRWLTLCASGKPLVLTIHKKASQCNCTQWVKTHCYSGYEFSYALKNNFEILINKGFALRPFGKPLVLTSINFDSLSRKIKNPCLVIKKFKSIKEIFKMKILKTKKLFTYIVVGALSLALSVSCSNEDTTGGGVDEELVQTNHNHPPAGIYYESGNTNWGAHTVTHNGGTCTIAGKVYPINGNNGLDYEVTITNWLNRPNSILPNLNYLGEYTIIKPESSIPFSSFDVKYDTTAETISVSLWSTSDGKFYSSLDLKRVE